MANLPFGQGESVTPMQMVAAYSAIANGGILRAPHVVQSVGGKATPVPQGHQIISATTASELRDMLRGVLADGGTASGAAIPGYDMAGKTGTANIAVDGHYSDSAYVASFIGMVPTEHPRLVVAVVVNQPHGSIYGGSVAAPAFQQIVGWAVPYLGHPAALAARSALAGYALRGRQRTVASELAPQPREPLVPLAADLGHPADGVRQRRRRELVADLAAGPLAVEQAGVGQRVEVLEHGLAGDRQLRGELRGGRGRMLGDRREQRAPGGVGEGAEHGAGAVVGSGVPIAAGSGRHAHAATSAGP